MQRPFVYSLAAQAISTPNVTPLQLSATSRLEGMKAVTLHANFAYGSGGETCSAIIRTRFGELWVQIARFDFTTSAKAKVCNLNGQLSKAVAELAALSVEGVVDGVLGDALDCQIVSAGTYVNTLLTVKAAVR